MFATIFFVLLAVLVIGGLFLGRRKAIAAAGGDVKQLHSLVSYHGWNVALAAGLAGVEVGPAPDIAIYDPAAVAFDDLLETARMVAAPTLADLGRDLAWFSVGDERDRLVEACCICEKVAELGLVRTGTL